MRDLTQEERRLVFEKLAKFLGPNLKLLIERPDEEPHVFRLHRERIYYMSENVLKKALHIKRKQLLCAGVCLGKFTHSRKFRLQVTCLDLLAKLAKHKVWVKANGEQSFLYGNNIVKAHLKRITEDTPKNAGVLVLSDQDVPLGFGTTARSVAECKTAGGEAIVVYHMSDVGEYLREEADLV
jgi:60S ribosome subunit biogenesis protein NIP7